MDSTPPQKDMTHQEEDIRVEDANPPPPPHNRRSRTAPGTQ